MTYWPVAILIVVFVLFAAANLFKSDPDTAVKCLLGSFGVSLVLGALAMFGAGVAVGAVVFFGLGVVFSAVSLAFLFFYKNA